MLQQWLIGTYPTLIFFYYRQEEEEQKAKHMPTELASFICLFFKYLFLLENNCFIMLCYFLLYNKVNQLLCEHIYSLPLEPPFHPPTPIPPLSVITEHQGEFPVLHSLPTSYFTHSGVHTSMLLSQFIPPSSPPTTLCELAFFKIAFPGI